MSISLMASAWRLTMPASKKLVLLALCDWANDDGGSLYPSIAAIASRSSMSERNAQRVVHELISEGWLSVVRNVLGGKPGQTRHYQLNAKAIYDGCQLVANENVSEVADTKCGPETGDKMSPLRAKNDDVETGDSLSPLRVTNATKKPETGDKLTPVRVTNDAETGDTGVTLTTIEPSIRALKERGARAPTPDDVDPEVWNDWLTLRYEKKAPVTVTAIRAIRREADKAGITLNAFLEIWCARGSSGLEASWLTREEKNQAAPLSAVERVRAANEAAGFGGAVRGGRHDALEYL